jgi:hypothetical protein
MNRIYIPTNNSEDWRPLLASPETQWRDGYSAKSLAESWQSADGFPSDIKKIMTDSGIHAFTNAEMLLGIPEYKVALPGGAAASQNDLFVLAGGKEGIIVIMVEGKVSESFGPFVSEWMVDASFGKKERLTFLCDTLGLPADRVHSLRYQFLHRAASALITANRFNSRHALMLVHSFSKDNHGFDDFGAFVTLFGVNPIIGRIQLLDELKGVSFYSAWAKSDLPLKKHRSSEPLSGKVTPRKCPCCGHHEIGITTDNGEFVALKTGVKIKFDEE